MNPILIGLMIIVLIFLFSKEGFFDVLKTLVIAMLIALSIRSFAYEPFSIPSGSMKPTLLVGDFLFVSKFSYGYSRYSVPFGRYIPLNGRILYDEPKRGDVAVFKFPKDNKTDYIKRIIGLPGDIINVKDSVVYVNGNPIKRDKKGYFEDYHRDGYLEKYEVYEETISSENKYLTLDDISFSGVFQQRKNGSYIDFDVNNTNNYTIPLGHFFALGDNREHSSDSRILQQVGFIPKDNLVGKAKILFLSIEYSTQKIRFLGKDLFKLPAKIRFKRIGNFLWKKKKILKKSH